MVCILENKDGTVQTTIREIDSETCELGERYMRDGKEHNSVIKVKKSLKELKSFYNDILNHKIKYDGE